MKWFFSLLIITVSFNLAARDLKSNLVLKNTDINLTQKGILSVHGDQYNFDLGKGPNDNQTVSSKASGLYDLVIKRSNNKIVSTTEVVKESSDIYATKHVVFGETKNDFFITNCRGKKGKIFNNVVCNSINSEICKSYAKLKDYDKDLFAKVNSCIDIEKKIDAFKDSYKKETETDAFKKKHLSGREDGRTALNKHANVLSITDVFNREMGKNLDKDGILEASWKEVNNLVKDCPGMSEKDYSLNNLGHGYGGAAGNSPFGPPNLDRSKSTTATQ